MARPTYREHAAKNVVDQCRKLGICLVACCGVHAIPVQRMRKYPGMVFMVQRYRDEILALLDGEVE